MLRNVGLSFLAQNWLTDIRIAMTSVLIMDIWGGIGFCMVLYLAGIQSIPKEYLEAAIVGGATGIQKFRYITLPLIMQSVSVNILLSSIGGLKVFSQVYALTNGGPADSTQVVLTYIYKAFSEGRYGFSSSISIVFTVIVAILSFAIIKPLRKKEVEY
jgi:raffinose/stachyose/melibiose transport system permease protein